MGGLRAVVSTVGVGLGIDGRDLVGGGPMDETASAGEMGVCSV